MIGLSGLLSGMQGECRECVEIIIKHDSEVPNLGNWGNPRKELAINQRFIFNLHGFSGGMKGAASLIPFKF